VSYRDKLVPGTEDHNRALQEIKLIENEIEIARIKHATNESERQKKALEDQEKLNKEFQDYLDKLEKANIRPPNLKKRSTDPYDFDLPGTWDKFKESVLKDGPTLGDSLAKLGEIGLQAFEQLAQGVGSMVEAWVLYGTAGPNALKKMVAAVLASVAAQAAVLAIFELAKGFAALFFNPAEAAAHFKAAALFGSIAVVAAVAGRSVAGDSFNQQASGGGSGGGGSGGQGSSSGSNEYGTPFRGYIEEQEKTRMVLGTLEETIHGFAAKVESFSAGEVLGMGAEQNPKAVRDAYESELGNDVRTTSGLMRGTGFAR
jgi:hypothetical protein